MDFPKPPVIVIVFISFLDLICLLHVGLLTEAFWKYKLTKSFLLNQAIRLVIWFLACGDTLTLTAFAAKGVGAG